MKKKVEGIEVCCFKNELNQSPLHQSDLHFPEIIIEQ